MAVNPWLNSPSTQLTGEIDLLQDLVDENFAAGGLDVTYLVRGEEDIDYLFGEAGVAEYDQSFVIEMYLQNVTNFNGDGDLFGKFGLEARDTATLLVSKRRFYQEVKLNEIKNRIEPTQGDLIFMPHSNTVWEVKRAKKDENYNSFGDWYSWRIEVSIYTPNHERISGAPFDDTNLSGQEIDADDFTLETLMGLDKPSVSQNEDLKEDAKTSLTSKVVFDANDPFGEN